MNPPTSFQSTGKAARWLILLSFLPLLLLGLQQTAMAEDRKPELTARAAEELFVSKIQPLLQQKCAGCHGEDAKKVRADLDVRTRAGLLRPAESGEPALIPGDAAASRLYQAVTWEDELLRMPPKKQNRLTADEVEWVRQWIAAGAPWPKTTAGKPASVSSWDDKGAADGVMVRTSGGLSAEWTNRKYKPEGLWAYRPVKKPRMPWTKIRTPRSELRNPIDVFIEAKMPEGLVPAPPADRRTLIRRATFDLTGLPPKLEEMEAFLRDPLPDDQAFGKVVERLLASPHYGERMAQHWLDVVRYADSSGFSNDYERGNAWRYRDYVVRSFNADKPYDRFVREQIAGDELDPNDPEMLIATGFLRMGPWELTAMEVAKVARQRFLDDVVHSVGETFLAHSLRCARCHDHKFDPVPTRDYYSIQAVFATTQLAERKAPFLPVENVAGFEEKKFLEKRREDYLATLRQLDEALLRNAERWFAEKGQDPARWNAAVAEVRRRGQDKEGRGFVGVFDRARGSLARQGVPVDALPPKFYGFTPEQYGLERIARKGLQRLRWELERYEPLALAVYDGRTPDIKSVVVPQRMPAQRMTAGELEETCILTGGDPFSPGEKVKPGVLSALDAVGKTSIPAAIEGRRRAFADWVASAENPLTTRAIVNRVWLWHFNQPLAGNPNNFGATGKKPTHPELLDWLAATFVEQGWSFKALHRLIMNSATYRRSAWHPDRQTLAEKDPAGTSYAAFKPRRLTAEELRDAMLAATGELNPMLGGIPNRPEINREAALQPRQVMGTFAAAWTPNPLPRQRHRRSIYALKLRGLANPLLEVFNAPSPDLSCERRETSTVTPQVFSLFNGRASHARALALANRAIEESTNDEQALTRCFTLVLSRSPTTGEVRDCLAHWREIEARFGDAVPTPVKPPLEVRRSAVEENTGEQFSFMEKLHANAEFVPDLQPADVAAHTRALADVCLVLFNSNEFAFVY